MTSLDVREMLDLPSAAGPRPAKKQKTVGSRPNLKGLQREVQSLGGDNPISIVPEVPQFKKRRLAGRKPAAHWTLKPFWNSARADDLQLRHWRRVTEPAPLTATIVTESAEGEEDPEPEPEMDDSAFAKFNVQVTLPKYDEDQYKEILANEEWSKEETDYLMSLAQEFDLRWPVIWDRYEYQPTPPSQESSDTDVNAMALISESQQRTMEDLKARYYTVTAIMMAVYRPVQSMSQAEFSLHQLMTNYDPAQEKKRKHFVETLMSRSAEERKEEESLLLELKRIMTRSEKLNEERKELYARLEAPVSTGNITPYTTSQGLQQLVQQLMTADKSKKRKTLLAPDGTTPAVGPSGQPNAGVDRRDSTNVRESTGPAGGKKGGASGPGGHRKLSEEEEIVYGVSRHERLTGGPSFRHEKVTRQITSKSAVQAQKITNALTELEIPARLTMPTADVTAQYEALLASINNMIDVKKVADKLDGEIKLAEAQKAEREKRERRERGEPEPEEVAGEEATGEVPADIEMGEAGDAVDKVEEGEDSKLDRSVKEKSAAPSVTPSVRAGSLHKRSASVLSQMSDKSTKRQKK